MVAIDICSWVTVSLLQCIAKSCIDHDAINLIMAVRIWTDPCIFSSFVILKPGIWYHYIILFAPID